MWIPGSPLRGYRIDERTRIDLAQCVAGVTVATASTSPLERF